MEFLKDATMTQAPPDPQQATADPGLVKVRNGIVAGLVAGAAYLLAQMAFAATVHGGAGWEPLQRMAAILLGPDAAPPPAEMSLTVAGIGLLIHLPLAGIYGRVLGWLVDSRPLPAALLRGAVAGLAIYLVHFWLLAPLAFPWFEQSRNVVTAIDHALFGALIALCYLLLRDGLSIGAPGKTRTP